MFMTSDFLQKQLSQLDQKVKEATHGTVSLEEYIALPVFGGQIIARFQTDEILTIEAVDELERRIQRLAKDEFLVDFMGSVYRRLGVDYARLNEINERLGRSYADEPMLQGPYAKRIQEDARQLLLRCALPETASVWEIQWEDGEYVLLLLGKENRAVFTVEDEPVIHVREVDETLCQGLMRAVFAARRRGVSLGRLMLEVMEN